MGSAIQHIIKWLWKNFELLFWSAAMIVLFFLPVNKSETSLCVFSLLGFGKCPGCGIGHSIHYALRADFASSFYHHPLGILAVLVIFNRIRLLIKHNKHHEQQPN